MPVLFQVETRAKPPRRLAPTVWIAPPELGRPCRVGAIGLRRGARAQPDGSLWRLLRRALSRAGAAPAR